MRTLLYIIIGLSAVGIGYLLLKPKGSTKPNPKPTQQAPIAMQASLDNYVLHFDFPNNNATILKV